MTQWIILQMWINLENSIRGEKSQMRKATYGLIPFIWNVQNREIHTDRKQLSGPRDGEMKKWEGTFNVYMVSFEGDEKVSEQDRGDGYILKRY